MVAWSGSRPTGIDVSRVVVLLVDDSRDEREMYAQHLQACGFQTMEAASADEGLRIASQFFPEVIVTDVAMPGSEDGFAFVKRLKENERTERIPAIILTGHGFDTHRDAAKRAKCDLFLVKPCLPAALEAAILDVLRDSTRSRQLIMREPLRSGQHRTSKFRKS